jgi:hypothetical protein
VLSREVMIVLHIGKGNGIVFQSVVMVDCISPKTQRATFWSLVNARKSQVSLNKRNI